MNNFEIINTIDSLSSISYGISALYGLAESKEHLENFAGFANEKYLNAVDFIYDKLCCDIELLKDTLGNCLKKSEQE